MDAFLMMGQSNMAGRGMLQEVPPIDNLRLFMLRNGCWRKMCAPVNYDRPWAGISLAESFALAYSEARCVEVGLIPCADGGSALDAWMPGCVLYDNAIACAKLAQRTATIRGILWHQGEADCISACYPHYEEKLSRMLAALRKNLNLPQVPVLVGGLGDYLACPTPQNKEKEYHNFIHINQALAHMAKADPGIGFVSAAGLLPNADGLHFNAASLRKFGKRYYDAFCAWEKSNPQKDFTA